MVREPRMARHTVRRPRANVVPSVVVGSSHSAVWPLCCMECEGQVALAASRGDTVSHFFSFSRMHISMNQLHTTGKSASVNIPRTPSDWPRNEHTILRKSRGSNPNGDGQIRDRASIALATPCSRPFLHDDGV